MAKQDVSRTRRTLGWCVPGLIMAALLVVSGAQAQEGYECEDVLDRKCTAFEEYGYCLNTAVDSFDECVEDASWLEKAGCYVAWEFDYYACVPETIIAIIK